MTITPRGDTTRAEILAHALGQSSRVGLEGLSIGTLAREVGMSKSGLFAHFGSKEDLQIAVLDAAAAHFVDEVVRPSLALPRGEPRVRAMVERWLAYTESSRLPGGCLFAAAAWEFDDRPGVVRDRVRDHVRDWIAGLARAVRIAQDEGHLDARVDPAEVAYRLHAAMLGYQVQRRLMANTQARAWVDRAISDILHNARSAS